LWGVDVKTLNRPVYSLADAAEILRMSPGTLAWWLDGGERGRRRPPFWTSRRMWHQHVGDLEP